MILPKDGEGVERMMAKLGNTGELAGFGRPRDGSDQNPSAMHGSRPRDPRRKVFLHARILSGERWLDVTICNVSQRGLMAQCSNPPRQGSYVEIRYRSCVMVGRVVWTRHDRFGLRTRDNVEVARLLGQPSAPLGAERRLKVRPPAAKSITCRHTASRHLSRLLQFGWMAAASVAAALFLATEVEALLAAPLDAAAIAMRSSNAKDPGSQIDASDKEPMS